MLIGEKGLSSTSDTRLKNDKNTALNQLYTAAVSGAKVIEDFQKFHDELKEVGDVLKAAGCNAYISFEYDDGENADSVTKHYIVDCNGKETYSVEESVDASMLVLKKRPVGASVFFDKSKVREIVLSNVTKYWDNEDKHKVTQYKKFQEAKKVTEQELFVYSSGSAAVARATQP